MQLPDGRIETIRYIGIDTPELDLSYKEGSPAVRAYLAWISHPPLGGWIFECDLEYFFLSGALAVEPRPVDGWS